MTSIVRIFSPVISIISAYRAPPPGATTIPGVPFRNIGVANRVRAAKARAPLATAVDPRASTGLRSGAADASTRIRTSGSRSATIASMPRCSWSAADDGRDLFEGHVKHVVQHERNPFSRGELLQHNQQCEADRVGDQFRLFEIHHLLCSHLSVRERLKGLLARFSSTQHIEADPRDDSGQPPAEIIDTMNSRAAEAQPCFLDCVLRLRR